MTTYCGKSCSFSLPRVPFVNCGQFMYLVISLLVLRAGCGICWYQFLIIAYLFYFKGVVFASIVFDVYLQINDVIKETQYPVFEIVAVLH